MKRTLDVCLAILSLMLFSVPMLIIGALVRLTSHGPAFYWSDRVGKNNKLFRMAKFRTMRVGTPAIATHLLERPDQHLTLIGGILRRTSLDELPQVISILFGDMSFVGPRPALYNQYDLINLRTERGVHLLVPGLTGWAQINGRDELPIAEKVRFDEFYLRNRSMVFDLRIVLLTVRMVALGAGVSH